MIKKCYRLMADKAVAEELGRAAKYDLEGRDYVDDIDEDYTTKREYIKAAKAYTSKINERYGLSCTWQELFGEPEDIGYRLCTVCGEPFWIDDVPPDCDDYM